MASSISAGTTSATALVCTADTSGALQLATNNGAVAVTVDTSQNVGVGTTTPTAKLVVSGGGAAVQGNGYPSTGAGWEFYTDMTTGSWAQSYSRTGSVWLDANWNALTHKFSTSGAERMRIDSSGNVGMGTTAPASATNTNSIAIIPSSGQILHQHLNGTASGSVYSYFIYNGAAIASISQNGTTAVSYNTSSDYRLKENIAPITGALTKVAALKPVTYKWKSAPDEVGEGFIAHELAEVCPQAVHGVKDAVDADGNPVYQGIDTSFLVATLAAAIQELTAKVTALEAKVGAST
jgi:hypothetical protein